VAAGASAAPGGEGSGGGSSSKGSSTGSEAAQGDRLVRYLGGNVSVRAVVATDLVREACLRHKASPIVSLALGRALMGTALLANGRDTAETLQLRILGSGPLGALITESTASMECRGFVGEPQADAATVPELIGLGEEATLRITRTHPFWKRPYTGTIQLKSGEIAEDLVQYLAISEQTPASMGLSVEWDSEAEQVKHAEGWLVTLLPGWDEADVGVVEANTASFSEGRMDSSILSRPEAICEHMTRELVGTFQTSDPLHWRCRCSTSRLLTAVMMLGKTEVLKMLKEKEDVHAICEWCGTNLSITPDQIREHMKSDEGAEEVATGTATPRQLKLKEEELREMPTPGTADWS